MIEIRIEHQQYRLSEFVKFFDTGKFKIYNDLPKNVLWQRDNTYPSRLISSIFLNVPIGNLWLWWAPDCAYRILDGNERLRIIMSFFHNEFKLEGLKWLIELNGLIFKELPNRYANLFKMATLPVNEVYPSTGINTVEEIVDQIRMGARDNRVQRWRNELSQK